MNIKTGKFYIESSSSYNRLKVTSFDLHV